MLPCRKHSVKTRIVSSQCAEHESNSEIRFKASKRFYVMFLCFFLSLNWKSSKSQCQVTLIKKIVVKWSLLVTTKRKEKNINQSPILQSSFRLSSSSLFFKFKCSQVSLISDDSLASITLKTPTFSFRLPFSLSAKKRNIYCSWQVTAWQTNQQTTGGWNKQHSSVTTILCYIIFSLFIKISFRHKNKPSADQMNNILHPETLRNFGHLFTENTTHLCTHQGNNTQL